MIVSTNAVKLNEYGRGRYSVGVWIIYKTSICNEIAVIDGTSPYFVTELNTSNEFMLDSVDHKYGQCTRVELRSEPICDMHLQMLIIF